MRFHLHQNMSQFFIRTIDIIVLSALWIKAHDLFALDNRGIITVGDNRAFRVFFMRIADHRKKRTGLVLAIDRPVGIENLVTAVFAVCLCEHHQFNVCRIAACPGKSVEKVIDFIVRQGKTQLAIGLDQCVFSTGNDIDIFKWFRFEFLKQGLGILAFFENHFCHAVMQFVHQLQTNVFRKGCSLFGALDTI